VKDVLVILCFALNIQLVPLLLGTAPSGGPAWHAHPLGPLLFLPVMSLAASVTAGLAGGYALSMALEHKLAVTLGQAARRALPLPGATAPLPPDGGRWRGALVLVAGALVFEVTRLVEAEPLTACVVAGLVLANRR
jgi:hypothetical protein